MKKRRKQNDEPNFWQPMADSLLGLLFIILLILLLLILYIIQSNKNDKTDYYPGYGYHEDEDDDDRGGGYVTTWITQKYHDEDHHDDYDNVGGGGYGGGDGDGTDDYPDPDPGREGDGMDRAAVWVQVVDGETNRTIKQEGIQFELYSWNSILQILNTYYPNRIEYKKFSTTEGGVFYLPEKIALSEYFFKNLTTVPGYDKADDVRFEIDKSYDWPEPYTVTIPMFPSKNRICVQLKDADTGKNLTGSTFDVIAAEDIRTKDETLRYEKGLVVDTIKLDQNGYGESIELYLGKYTLRQHDIPLYYARVDDVPAEVASKAKGKAPVHEIYDPKTRVHVTLTDALYSNITLEDVEYTLTNDKGDVLGRFRTDDFGKFTVTDLYKSTKYHLRQSSAKDMYIMDDQDHIFTVDKDGFIDNKVAAEIKADNILTRVSFGVCDYLLRGQISDVNMAVFGPDDEVLKVWNSTGLEQMIEGLQTDDHLLVMRGRREKGRRFTVEEIPDVQVHVYYLWTTTDTIIVVVLSIVLILFIIFLVKYIKRKRQDEKNKKEGKVST